MEKNITNYEYRMYGLVPYNLSPIQQGIQFGHAVQEYNNNYFGESGLIGERFNQWRLRDKTFIILNGGTTNNNNYDSLGSLNKHLMSLIKKNIPTAEFNEPDLGNQLTAVVFIVDERVFNKEKYPDYVEYILPEDMSFKNLLMNPTSIKKQTYGEWVEMVGGLGNVFLRGFLEQFKLA